MFYCHWEGQPRPGLEKKRDRGKKGGIEKQGDVSFIRLLIDSINRVKQKDYLF
jgi:hypothetical protein